MTCREVEALVDAYVDGELDAARSRDVDAHLASCDGCQARIEQVATLRRAVAGASYHRAPAALLDRIRTTVSKEEAASVPPAEHLEPARTQPAPSRPRFTFAFGFASGLAAAACAFVVITAVIHTGVGPAVPIPVFVASNVEADVVSAHIRSLMPGHTIDVVSTDQHTVKPWFAGKLDFSPTVRDLAVDGFPLVGGRLDYVGDRPVAALVYKRYKHTINLFEWPAPGTTAVERSQDRGYNVYTWTSGGEAHYAVTDAAPAEVDRFVDLLSKP